MIVHMEIAKGYRDSAIKELELQNPSWDKLTATEAFVHSKYGEWIKRVLGDDFKLIDITENNFRIDFTYEDDAKAFMFKIGGRELEQ